LAQYYERGWHYSAAICWTLFFSFIDFLWFGATIPKFVLGGYVPVAIAAFIATTMLVVRAGYDRARTAERTVAQEKLAVSVKPRSQEELSRQPVSGLLELIEPLNAYLQSHPKMLALEPQKGEPSTLSIFLTNSITTVPLALVNIVKTLNVFPRHVLFLSVEFLHVPFASPNERLFFKNMKELGGPEWLNVAILRVGFAEHRQFRLDSLVLRHIMPKMHDDMVEMSQRIFYVSNRNFVAHDESNIFERLWLSYFTLLHNNAHRVSQFFGLPLERTIEMSITVPL